MTLQLRLQMPLPLMRLLLTPLPRMLQLPTLRLPLRPLLRTLQLPTLLPRMPRQLKLLQPMLPLLKPHQLMHLQQTPSLPTPLLRMPHQLKLHLLTSLQAMPQQTAPALPIPKAPLAVPPSRAIRSMSRPCSRTAWLTATVAPRTASAA